LKRLVDADPQGDLTKCLGIANPQELTLTLATAMNSVIYETEFDSRSVILHHQEGVDFIPANSELNAIETTLVTTMDIDRRCVLRDYLGLLRDGYRHAAYPAFEGWPRNQSPLSLPSSFVWSCRMKKR
jgi:chromosome partitioning protein